MANQQACSPADQGDLKLQQEAYCEYVKAAQEAWLELQKQLEGAYQQCAGSMQAAQLEAQQRLDEAARICGIL